MRILVVGSGGREHALAWKAAQPNYVETVFVAPGNAGTHLEPKLQNVDISVTDIPNLVNFAKSEKIDFTIIGPEAPLVLGIVDTFQENGLKCFGPSKVASQLEGSKAFTKDFLKRHHIPSAEYGVFTDIPSASNYLRNCKLPIVIKADGLAAGKGVIIAETEQDALTTIEDMLAGNKFGEAGHRVVIEEFLQGEEASFIVMVDGKNILPLATSQDHKARDEGDTGPNTGGMGAYSPAPVVTPDIHQRVMHEVIIPTVNGMASEGAPYTGFLYAGLMISPNGKLDVLEYNCRFGDPETQPIMMRLKSDLNLLIEAALEQKLNTVSAEWDNRCALGVVLAAGGYPDKYTKGDEISGLNQSLSDNTKVFHAGTALSNDKVQTNGGRVLCAVALGESASQAQLNAYDVCKNIHWNNMYYRKDIGFKAIARENNSVA